VKHLKRAVLLISTNLLFSDNAPTRATQAASPLLFGVLMDEMGIGVLAISAGLSLSALFALLLLKARPATAPVPA